MPASSDIKLLQETVRKAGAIALEFFNTSAKSWDKSDGSPVTEADLAVDKYLKEKLMTARPDYGWLSEETKDNQERLSCKRVWIVDPIDGTSAFVKHSNEWSISIGLVENGKPILGVVFQPTTGDFYFAQKGKGVTLNGDKISTRDCRELKNSQLIARTGLLNPSRWKTPWPKLEQRVVVSLALRICKVADGSFDGTINRGNESEWDTAAADLIIAEAGGYLTDFIGELITYNNENPKLAGGLIAGGKNYHRLLAKQAKTFIKKID